MSTPALAVRGLSKTFGGIAAAQDVTMALAQGARHALIGPNGAGKTTLVNLLTGLIAPSAGTIELGGVDITSLSTHRRARMGLVRTFQINQLFTQFTPLETLALVCAQRAGLGGRMLRALGRHPAVVDEAAAVLAQFHLADVMHRAVSELAIWSSGDEVYVGSIHQRAVMPELKATSQHVGRLQIVHLNHYMRYADPGIPEAGLSRFDPQILCVGADVRDRLEVDLRQIVANPGLERSRRCVEQEPAGQRQTKLHRQTGAAQARVAAQSRLGAVAVIVAHPDVALPGPLEEDHAIGSDTRTACCQRPDTRLVFEAGCGALCRIKNDEIVSRARHLVEVLAFRARHHYILPVRLHHRRRQTIQTASRTIFFDILLSPSVRSTKMIGISKRLKPRFQAR